MAILTESSSPIEFLLKTALQHENLEFKEQHRIYERATDLYPKYVVDFVITYQDLSIIVECDGAAYHRSDADVERGIERDCWLTQRGYKKILHFTTYQLKYEMNTVILTIKHNLGIIKVPKEQLRFKGKKIRRDYIDNINDSNLKLHDVTLYYAYIQVKDKVWITYKFYDSTLNQYSDERSKTFYNVPEKLGHQLAIYVALKDLKKSVKLLIYCSSSWLTAYMNKSTDSEPDANQLLERICEELVKHNYLCKYINTHRSLHYYRQPSSVQLIVYELYSRCRQLCYKGRTVSPNTEEINFTEYRSNIILDS